MPFANLKEVDRNDRLTLAAIATGPRGHSHWMGLTSHFICPAGALAIDRHRNVRAVEEAYIPRANREETASERIERALRLAEVARAKIIGLKRLAEDDRERRVAEDLDLATTRIGGLPSTIGYLVEIKSGQLTDDQKERLADLVRWHKELTAPRR
jgi:hypothetical protein